MSGSFKIVMLVVVAGLCYLLLSQWGLLVGRGEIDYFFFEFGRGLV